MKKALKISKFFLTFNGIMFFQKTKISTNNEK